MAPNAEIAEKDHLWMDTIYNKVSKPIHFLIGSQSCPNSPSLWKAIGKTPVLRLLDLEPIVRGSVEAPQSANRSFQFIA